MSSFSYYGSFQYANLIVPHLCQSEDDTCPGNSAFLIMALLCYFMASSNNVVLQSYLFEPKSDSQRRKLNYTRSLFNFTIMQVEVSEQKCTLPVISLDTSTHSKCMEKCVQTFYFIVFRVNTRNLCYKRKWTRLIE